MKQETERRRSQRLNVALRPSRSGPAWYPFGEPEKEASDARHNRARARGSRAAIPAGPERQGCRRGRGADRRALIIAGAQGVGLIDHAGYVRMMEHATWTILDFTIGEDVQVRLLGNEAAVVAYTVHEQLEVDGDRVAFDAADTSTWVRRAGRWLCAAHTESIA